VTRKRPAYARIAALVRAVIAATFFSSLPAAVLAAAKESTDPMTSRTKAHIPGVVLPDFPADVAPGTSLEVAVRIGVNPEGHVNSVQDYVEPEFPRTLIERRVAHGSVVTHFRVDEQGRVMEVLDAFAWPSPLFNSDVRSAMAQWRIRRVDREPSTAPFSACIEVDFRLR